VLLESTQALFQVKITYYPVIKLINIYPIGDG